MNLFYKNQVPFEWKYWMTLHAFWIQIELNWIESKFLNSIQIIEWNSNSNSTIEIKIELNWNEMQIDGEGMENLLVNMVLGKKKYFKNT
jgi:hypothetical protein